jgi:hypothetical protein
VERSADIAQIAAAIVGAQADMPRVPKAAENPFFKSRYADLAGIIETAQPVLAAHGLGVVQSADCDGDVAAVETMLLHTSGEWISSRTVLKPAKPDPQGMGSAITYARRYAYMAIVGMASEDDDGNAATKPVVVKPSPRQPPKDDMEKKRAAYFANAAKLGVEGEQAKATVKGMFELEHFAEATVEQLRDAYMVLKEESR